MVNESVSKKIKALLEKTTENGCSESEALAAAKKAQELLNKHNLSMSEVEFNSAEFETLKIDTGNKKRGYMHRVFGAIANFTDCYTYYTKSAGRTKYHNLKYIYFGEKTSTQLANYLYDLLLNSIEYEAKKYKNSDEYADLEIFYSARTIMNSFRSGMAFRLAERLNEMKAEKERENSSDTSIVLYDRAAIVKNKFDNLNPEMVIKDESKFKINVSGKAFESGETKANDINISQGLKEGDREILRLN